jgi:DNA polymerase-4/DNA polymerase V
MGTNEWILHIDGDGFFAYCEIARFPQYHGKAVVVGEDRGIACAMTYEAKRLGIARGMPIFKIREQYPNVIILTSHFELYEHYAHNLFTIVEPYVDILERYSIDECFASVCLPSTWNKEQLHAWLFAIKKKAQHALGITFSFGMARTKVLAKIASKLQKPDGCTILSSLDEVSALQQTPIDSVWGIGYRMAPQLQGIGVRTAYDFISLNQGHIERYNTPVQSIWHELRGVPLFSVSTSNELPKSLQSTKSFTPFSGEKKFVLAELMQNIDIVTSRMRGYGVMARAVSVYLKTKDRQYISSFAALPNYTYSPVDITAGIIPQIAALFKEGLIYRSTGVTVWGLCPIDAVPYDMFNIQEESSEKGKAVFSAVDSIRSKFGAGSIGLLSALSSAHDRTKKRNILEGHSHYIPGLPLPYLGETT